MTKFLDGLAFFVVGALALGLAAVIVAAVIQEPLILLVAGVVAAFWWAIWRLSDRAFRREYNL